MNLRILRSSFALTSATALAACTPSAYAKYYSGTVPAQIPGYISTTAAPVIEGASNIEEAQTTMFRKGFVLIGTSSFWAEEDFDGISSKDLAKFAKRLGAQRVVTVVKLRGITQGTDLVSVPTRETERTTATVQSGGRTATGTSTSRRRGTETVAVPYSVERSNYDVLYFVKARSTLGVMHRALSDTESQQIGTNRGVVVLAIANGSPAFFADLLPGDFLLDVQGQAIQSSAHFSSLLREQQGQEVTLQGVRRGQPFSKRVTILLPE
jgi:serine protease Do